MLYYIAVAGRTQDWAEIDTFNVQSSMEILHILWAENSQNHQIKS